MTRGGTDLHLALETDGLTLGPWTSDPPTTPLGGQRRFWLGPDQQPKGMAALVCTDADDRVLTWATALPQGGEPEAIGAMSLHLLPLCGPAADRAWLFSSFQLLADLALVRHVYPPGSQWFHRRTGGPYVITGTRKVKHQGDWSIGIDYERKFPFGTLAFERATVAEFAASFQRAR